MYHARPDTYWESLKFLQHLNANNLVLIDFTTVHEYLFLLREIAKSLQSRGENVLYYLAAAVSDFHVPSDKMVGLKSTELTR